MNTYAIRIYDMNGEHNSIQDVLKEIFIGNELKWSIIYLEATGNLENSKFVAEFVDEIDKHENGFFISWQDLNEASQKIYQIIDTLILASKNEKLLHRYKDDHEMYETCEIVIQMIDSSYWEVFSHDINLINRLGKKFKNIKFIKSWEDLGEG